MRRKLFVRIAVAVSLAMAMQAAASIGVMHRFFEVNPLVDQALLAYTLLAAISLTIVLTVSTERELARMLRKEEQRLRLLQLKDAEIDATQAQLTRAEQLALVGRLSAGIAHEIGNPLAAVIGYLALLRDELPNNDIIERSDRELHRINGLIRELLDYARPAPLKKEWQQLAPILEQAISLLKHQPRGAGVSISNRGEDAKVHVDRERTVQILLNVLLNAADAMNGKGDIEIEGRKEDAHWALKIVDHGPGFSADALKHAGEPFYSSKGVGKGTGLGLAVSRRLMQEQGGELRIANQTGAGAAITLLLRREMTA